MNLANSSSPSGQLPWAISIALPSASLPERVLARPGRRTIRTRSRRDLAGITSASQLTDSSQISVTLLEIDRCSVSRWSSVISSNVISRCDEISASCRLSWAADCCNVVLSAIAALTSCNALRRPRRLLLRPSETLARHRRQTRCAAAAISASLVDALGDERGNGNQSRFGRSCTTSGTANSSERADFVQDFRPAALGDLLAARQPLCRGRPAGRRPPREASGRCRSRRRKTTGRTPAPARAAFDALRCGNVCSTSLGERRRLVDRRGRRAELIVVRGRHDRQSPSADSAIRRRRA